MTDKNPRVLVVGPFSEAAGGVITFQRNLIRHSNLKSSWTFIPYNISRPPKTGKSQSHGYKAFLEGGLNRAMKGGLITAGNMLRFKKAVADVDIVQIQSSDYYSFWEAAIYTRLAKLFNKPTCVRFGGHFESFYESQSTIAKDTIRHLLKQPDQMIVQSEYWFDYFGKLTDRDRLNVVNNGVPSPPPIPIRQDVKTPISALFIATAEARRKGVEEVLLAAEALSDKVHFTFVGCTIELQDRIRECHFSHAVKALPSVSRETLNKRLYPEADLFLIPSHGEGFPNSMLEAMAAGLPIIGSFAGAIPEVIIDGVNGYLNEAGDAEALIEDIETLADDPSSRIEMGRLNHQKIIEKYTLDKVFQTFDTAWRKAISDHRQR